MSKKAKLDTKMKESILMGRMHGETGRSIAERLPVSHSVVYTFLASLPGDDAGEKGTIKPQIPDEYIERIFSMYLDGMECDAIADSLGISYENVVRLFAFVKQNKREKLGDYPLYPAVSQWMAENGYSVSFLAKMLGAKKAEVLGALSGRKYQMSRDLAQAIQNVSGLTLSQIYGESSASAASTGSQASNG